MDEAVRQARRRLRLEQMGVTRYRPRAGVALAAPVRQSSAAAVAPPEPPDGPVDEWPSVSAPPVAPVRPSPEGPAPSPTASPQAAGVEVGAEPATSEVIDLDWAGLEARVAGCRECGLCEGRTQTVFGVGDRQADLVLVGEGPGAEEDRRGEPFVGQAGQLLDRMLAAIGLDRHHGVYICNVVKCRPPRNRDPKAEEAAACRPYLHRQLSLLQPRLVVALGRVPAHHLLGVTTPLGRLRGQLHRYEPVDVPLLATYHPAYLLRSPADKARAWQDLKRIRRILAD